ncbi:hypothetical protein M2138_001765 [Dysgonomonadaceae bacterium PH5-43]|nr:hypothetical protein [Dysgonomonadaceae bacterium PH5-43]
MKKKFIIITVFSIVMSCQIFAQDIFREKTDNWTKREVATDRANLINANTNPTNGDPKVTPIGDAWLLVLGLAGIYTTIKIRKRGLLILK